MSALTFGFYDGTFLCVYAYSRIGERLVSSMIFCRVDGVSFCCLLDFETVRCSLTL